MGQGQVLPPELIRYISWYTLEPWPAHYGTLYNAAISSRFNNPFLLVNKAYRQIILDELAEVLWLELEWHGTPGKPDFLQLFSRPGWSSAYDKILPRGRPTVKFILANPADIDAAPDPIPPSVTLPFNYQDFAYIFDTALSCGYSIDLSVLHMTTQTSEYMDRVIKPLLPFLMGNPGHQARWDVRIYAERIPNPGYSRWPKHLENVKGGYHEYRRLRTLSLNSEARAFALQAICHLYDTWESRNEGLYGPEMFPEPFALGDTALYRIRCKKIMLQFSILAASTATDICHEDPLWFLERSPAFTPLICKYVDKSIMYFGFPDSDLALCYHAIGLLDYTLAELAKAIDINARENHNPTHLAAATAICPENETWRHDTEKSIDFFRRHYGDDWTAEWDRRCKVHQVDYVGIDGLPRVWTGIDKGDWNSATPRSLERLPAAQELHNEVVEELERESGIEHGNWQMD